MANQEPVIVRADEGAVHKTPFGDRLRWLAGEAETVGGYSLHDRLAPPGARSTPHTHRGVTEAFYVMDGELELQIGDEKLMGTAGTFVLAPANVTHAWRNTGDRDAHVLVLFTPPVAYEYFEELDRITTSVDRSDPSAIAALAEQYGLDQVIEAATIDIGADSPCGALSYYEAAARRSESSPAQRAGGHRSSNTDVSFTGALVYLAVVFS